jgi:putative acetyltransferase
MHPAETARGRSVGSAMLSRLLAEARSEGLARVSLETGSWDYFEPARRRYRRHGFVSLPPFEGYEADPNSVFMTSASKLSAGVPARMEQPAASFGHAD